MLNGCSARDSCGAITMVWHKEARSVLDLAVVPAGVSADL